MVPPAVQLNAHRNNMVLHLKVDLVVVMAAAEVIPAVLLLSLTALHPLQLNALTNNMALQLNDHHNHTEHHQLVVMAVDTLNNVQALLPHAHLSNMVLHPREVAVVDTPKVVPVVIPRVDLTVTLPAQPSVHHNNMARHLVDRVVSEVRHLLSLTERLVNHTVRHQRVVAEVAAVVSVVPHLKATARLRKAVNSNMPATEVTPTKSCSPYRRKIK